MSLEERRRKALFVCYDGGVVVDGKLSPYIIRALSTIVERSDFEPVLLKRGATVDDDVIESLTKEGIFFEDVFDTLEENEDYNRKRSFLVSTNVEDAKYAGTYAIRSFLIASFSDVVDLCLSSDVILSDNWMTVCSYLTNDEALKPRIANVKRSTKETDISLYLNLDGRGDSDISTGIGFFDHMLEQLAKHGRFDIKLSVEGDLDVDEHHTIEDVAIVLGSAMKKALGDRRGIDRFGFDLIVMDEVLVTIALDLSNRTELLWEADKFTRDYIGDFPTDMFRHFFKSFADSAGATMFVAIDNVGNNHHMAEAIFKGFGRALRHGVKRVYGDTCLPSTKGSL